MSSALRQGCFVTGTDTGIGKTRASLGLMHMLREQGYSVAGMKPVATGCRSSARGLRNEDAEALARHASKRQPYACINPYAFQPAIAPHIAARQCGTSIDFMRIAQCLDQLGHDADYVIVEGIGGWLVPLQGAASVADLALYLRLPVILVVGLRLGCLNHTLLTYADMRRRGTPLSGWIANDVEENFACAEANIHALTERIAAPLLGRIPHLAKGGTAQELGKFVRWPVTP